MEIILEEYFNSKILAVDDSAVNIHLLKSILENESYEVFTASSGEEALEIIPEIMPDAILLDIIMPGMSGIDTLNKIITDKAFMNIPVIMVTGKTNEEDVKIALDKGAVDYLKKLASKIELLARLRTSLRIKMREDSMNYPAAS